jgi:hypothetical protein
MDHDIVINKSVVVQGFLSPKQIKKQEKKRQKDILKEERKVANQKRVQIKEEKDQLDKIARNIEKAKIAEEKKRIEKEKEEEYNRIREARRQEWLIEYNKKLIEYDKKLREQIKEANHRETLRNDTYPDIKLEITVIMTTKLIFSKSVEYEGEWSIDVKEDIILIKKQEKMIANLPRVFDNYVKDNKEAIDLSDPIFNNLFKSCKMIYDMYKTPKLDIEIISDNVQLGLDNYKIIGAKIIR